MRRFLSNCRLVQFKESMFKMVVIKVSYGLKMDKEGKMTEFTNEGAYDNSKDLIYAAEVFANEK